MAHSDTLITIRASLEAELTAETAYRAAHGPKPTYTANGRTVDWNGYLAGMTKAIADLTAVLNSERTAEDPFEITTHGRL